MNVITWNVLHRIHAVNWNEPVIAKWPKEGPRLGSIADFIVAQHADVVCLQEASGDMLQMLRDVVDGEIMATPFPRVPEHRGTQTTPLLREATEYLVTITRDASARLVAAETFPTDGGKGFQRIELRTGETVINTHVSFGDKRPAQLARLATEARAAPGTCILCGDFNAERDVCIAELGEDFIAGIWPSAALPTRPRHAGSGKSQNIDHVFIRAGGLHEIAVLDGESRSDHNPVRARF